MAFSEFYPYLYSFSFTLIKEHNPLTALKDVGGCLARWMMFLQQFQLKIKYKQGKAHSIANVLSRTTNSGGESRGGDGDGDLGNSAGEGRHGDGNRDLGDSAGEGREGVGNGDLGNTVGEGNGSLGSSGREGGRCHDDGDLGSNRGAKRGGAGDGSLSSSGGEDRGGHGYGGELNASKRRISMHQEQKDTTGKEKNMFLVEGSNQVLVHYEMNEPERAFQKQHGSFVEAAHQEKMRERDTLELVLLVSISSLPKPCVLLLTLQPTFIGTRTSNPSSRSKTVTRRNAGWKHDSLLDSPWTEEVFYWYMASCAVST